MNKPFCLKIKEKKKQKTPSKFNAKIILPKKMKFY